MTRGLSTITVLGATLLAVFLAACGGEPTTTTAPAGTTTPRLITVNPAEDPAGLLSALPRDERDCLEQAVGPEKLEEFIASNDLGDVILQACIGEETLRAVILGETARQVGGLSDDTVSCLFDETASLDFPDMVFGDEIGPGVAVVMQATALCLSDEDLLQLEGFDSGDQRPNVEQLRCAMLLNPQPIAVNGQPDPKVAELFEKCDEHQGLPEEPAEPPPLTAEEEACLINAIGEPAMREVYAGQRSPTPEELEAFAGCFAGGSDAAPSPPQMEFPDFETLPEIPAPMENSTVVWPSSVQDASALLERLPDEIAGHRLTERQGGLGDFRSDFNFGEDPETQEPVLVARILDLAQGDFFPAGTTAGELVAFFAQGFDWEVLAAGREGSLGWVQIKTYSESLGVTRDIYGLLWGNAPGSSVFNAQANNPAELAAVVQAMVSAAR